MPEVGTKVYLNIVDREEGNAYAVGCIRLNGAVCLETQNPNNRLLANESGKNVKLYPASGIQYSKFPVSGFHKKGYAFFTS